MAGRTTVARGRPDPHALHVYLLEVAAGDAREGAWSRLLAPEEAARRARLRHPASRSEYTAARALVRTALSLHAPLVSPAQWRIEADPRGRPRIVSPGTALDFNLAHTRGLVCCLIFTGRRAGIDVEWMDRPGDLRRVARRFFSPDEVADLERQREPSAFRRRFFDYWTLKEAWLKA
ncbi:MAG: 4'-phosphopantetheinyl transferase superfamily protein, partial [Deltaproteobacteria bacterium]